MVLQSIKIVSINFFNVVAPDQPEGLRTPPVFSKHPQIRALGRQLRYRPDEFDVHPKEKFQPAQGFFAGEPSPFIDPREAERRGIQPQELEGVPSGASVPEMEAAVSGMQDHIINQIR